MRANDYAGGGSRRSLDSYFGISDKDTGYYIETDITFSDKCKQSLKDFPPNPNHTAIKFIKLMLTFEKKFSYETHYTLEDAYSLNGVEFSNIKRVLAFHQKPFLNCWIELNTEKFL